MKTKDSAFVKDLIVGILWGFIFLMGVIALKALIALIDWLLWR